MVLQVLNILKVGNKIMVLTSINFHHKDIKQANTFLRKVYIYLIISIMRKHFGLQVKKSLKKIRDRYLL